ncbi:hypothetical protein Zmor_017169 [Zophobas morio]|uniref:Uncharacterized protein n=1 Tax=Zophobas morio TaxID=2755281 RepID=A0AA38MBR3_9CUCU|nr:hypothetical protein Zmor_017169 [Zophobas morio]
MLLKYCTVGDVGVWIWFNGILTSSSPSIVEEILNFNFPSFASMPHTLITALSIPYLFINTAFEKPRRPPPILKMLSSLITILRSTGIPFSRKPRLSPLLQKIASFCGQNFKSN